MEFKKCSIGNKVFGDLTKEETDKGIKEYVGMI